MQKANNVTITTRQDEAFPYFENPHLLFQFHNLKNIFARPSLHESISLFGEIVLAGLDPAQLDMHSCWLDIGNRDWVHLPPPLPRAASTGPERVSREEAWTLLWKSQCLGLG
ncbi:hypothetical protein EDB80DRAFT_871647, partial [Ilyonectria destructans]